MESNIENKMKTYNVVFQGYRRDEFINELPEYTGIYMVYRCIHHKEHKTVTLKELMYIGQAENIKKRLSKHNKREDFEKSLIEGEQICYSYAEVNEEDLDIVENALIFAQKPRLNDDFKEHYNHEPAHFIIEGKCSLLNHKTFTIKQL